MSNNFAGNRIPDSTFCNGRSDWSTLLSAYTCTQIVNNNATATGIVVNGQSFSVPGLETTPYNIKSVNSLASGICLQCYCFNCGHPDAGLKRTVTISGETRNYRNINDNGYVVLGMSGVNN